MKTLVDTSVWITHLKAPAGPLVTLLKNNQVLVHSAVIGELACGRLKNRTRFLNDLALLPFATEADSSLVMDFIERHRLHGKGLGWVDVQLLVSAKLSGARLLTGDRRLSQAAAEA